MEYRFILKDNNQKGYRLFTWFLFFLHIVAAGILALNAGERNGRMGLYILMGIYVLLFFTYYFSRKINKAMETFSLVMAVLYANFWLKYVGVTALLIFVTVYIFVMVVQRQRTTVQFSATGIQLKRLFKMTAYSWPELDNVILKDNLLTIDLRSNKLIQAETETGNETVDENKFNQFCKEQLSMTSTKNK